MNYKHAFKFCMSTVTNVSVVRNSEAVSEKFNIHSVLN